MDRVSLLLPFSSSRAGATLRSLWTWWLRELQGMVPPRLRRMLRGSGHVLLVDVTDRLAIVRRVRAQGEEEIGRILLENADAANRQAQFAIYADRLPRGPRQVIARVPATRVLRKVLDLPAVAQENLHEILGLEMDRLTPFAAADVYYTHRILEVDRQSKRLIVELLILPRAAAEPAMETVRDLGLRPDRLEVMTEGPRGLAPEGARVDFLPASAGAAPPLGRRPLTIALAATAFALLVAAMVLPLQQQRQLTQALEADVAAAKVKADAARKLQAEMEQAIAQSNFIIDRKRNRPAFIDVLDELTTLLPDNTWLIRIRYYHGELQAFGNSPSASALVGVLEASQLLAEAQFRAPVTRDPRLGVERFHIGAQVGNVGKEEAP
ncbi:MAG: PilN domain-containing protein [Rhodospirillales bacterium]